MAIMKAAGGFDKVAMDFEPLPAGSYRTTIEECEDKKTSTNKDQTSVKLVVSEGEFKGRVLFDNLVWTTDKGEPNKVSYGRLRAYTEAIHGKEAAQVEEIDTESLVGGSVEVVLQLKTRKRQDTGEVVTENRIVKVLSAA